MSIKVFDVDYDLTGQTVEVWLNVTCKNILNGYLYPANDLYPSDDLFPMCVSTSTTAYLLFTGTIESAYRQKNRSIKEIIAYDRLYYDNRRILTYFSQLAQYSPTASLDSIRTHIEENVFGVSNTNTSISGLNMFNSSQSLSLDVNHVKDVAPADIMAIDLLKDYAELNAAFVRADNRNRIKFSQLSSADTASIPYYSSLEWDEFETAAINIADFVYNGQSKNRAVWGTADAQVDLPSHYVSENIITWCCSNPNTIISYFKNNGVPFYSPSTYRYRPYRAKLFDFWWLEPGDKVTIQTGADDTPSITSYVFNMTISGITNIKTEISAEGKRTLGKD